MPRHLSVSVVPLLLIFAGCEGGGECLAPPAADLAVPSTEPVFASTADPFQPGPLAVRTVLLDQCEHDAPRPLRIVAPEPAGDYAVVQFQHGFFAPNLIYDTIARHLASHGFVVVLPQMYPIGPAVALGDPSAAEEAVRAAAVLAWMPDHLAAVVGVTARPDRLGLAGHSRGGKVAWLLLKADPARALGVAGVDPVDGGGGPLGGQPRAIDGPLDFPFPSLVIGAGLGGPCAPAGDNHVQFFEASAAPAWHVVATDYGHADMCDEPFAGLSAGLCPSGGEDREPMRRLVAGLLTAFFRGTLQGDATAFAALQEAETMPAAATIDSR